MDLTEALSKEKKSISISKLFTIRIRLKLKVYKSTNI